MSEKIKPMVVFDISIFIKISISVRYGKEYLKSKNYYIYIAGYTEINRLSFIIKQVKIL